MLSPLPTGTVVCWKSERLETNFRYSAISSGWERTLSAITKTLLGEFGQQDLHQLRKFPAIGIEKHQIERPGELADNLSGVAGAQLHAVEQIRAAQDSRVPGRAYRDCGRC